MFSLMTINPYSTQVNLLFEKAAENALLRFKTPVITSEILFLTLMESTNIKVSKSNPKSNID